jgi:hypothetical protein
VGRPLQRALTLVALALALAAGPGSGRAERLDLQWGLENTWSYREEQPGRTDDVASIGRAGGAGARRYRTFAFNEGMAEVREPWLACIDAVMGLWGPYLEALPAAARGDRSDAARRAFQAHVRERDPGCVAQFRKTAPQLYFDFVADDAAQWVLEQVEVTTLGFSEYKGGGFAEGEAGYDLVLAHRAGLKTYRPEPRLVFKERGRLRLRLWSDNVYPNVGWIAPMGEYTLDIAFVFSVQGRRVTVRTGAFKIDV